MHGNAGPVERKIRLWIMQRERERREEGQMGQLNTVREALVDRRRRTGRPRER